jgi:outer membrane cobalamin receptor
MLQLKFIRGLIAKVYGQLKVQLKEIERGRTEMNFGQNQNFGTIHLFLYFSGKTGLVTSFASAFNAPNIHQI